MNKNIKVILSASLGNVLEFLDFTLFGIFASVLAPLFFPTADVLSSYLLGFGAFAAGFLARPLGAIVFGWIGDQVGRKRAFSLSIILMGFSTLLIGVAPTYATIGPMASFYIFFCRIFQGICAGGEFNGSAVFVLERVEEKQKGFYGGILVSACISGTLLATLFWMVYKNYAHVDWAWRVPFFVGSLVALVGYFLRRSLSEQTTVQERSKYPVVDCLRHHFSSIMTMISIGGFNGCVVYTLFSYSIFYQTKICGLESGGSTYASLAGLLTLVVLNPYLGKLGDRFGHRRLMLWAAIIAVPFSYLYYRGLASPALAPMVQCIMGITGALYISNQHAVSVDLFPPQTRYTGTSLGYSLGMGFLGGTTPLISTYLISKTGMVEIPFVWLAFCALFTALMLGGRKVTFSPA